jgi:hypothetical protein
MNLNQPAVTFIVFGVWLVSPPELLPNTQLKYFSVQVTEKMGRCSQWWCEANWTPTCFSLPKTGKLHNFQNIYSYIG